MVIGCVGTKRVSLEFLLVKLEGERKNRKGKEGLSQTARAIVADRAPLSKFSALKKGWKRVALNRGWGSIPRMSRGEYNEVGLAFSGQIKIGMTVVMCVLKPSISQTEKIYHTMAARSRKKNIFETLQKKVKGVPIG